MMQKSRHNYVVFSLICLAGLFSAVLYWGLHSKGKAFESPLLGVEATGKGIPILQGGNFLGLKDTVDLSLLRGSPLILNFWASWCSSCAEEAPLLEGFWKEHQDAVKVLGIAVHDKSEDALSFAHTHGKTYALALDADGSFSLNYGVTGVPETVFINAQGQIVHKEVGPLSHALLDKLLAQMTSELHF